MRRWPLASSLITFVLAGCGAQPMAPPPPPLAPPPPPPAVGAAAPNAPSAAYDVLLVEWTGPHGGVPPWDKVDNKLFAPAVDKAGELLLKEVAAIAEIRRRRASTTRWLLSSAPVSRWIV